MARLGTGGVQDDFGGAILSGAGAYLPSMLQFKPTTGDLNYTSVEGTTLVAGTQFIGHGIIESVPGASGTGNNFYSGQLALANSAPFASTDTNIVQPTPINVVGGTLTLGSNFAGDAALGFAAGALTNSSQTNQRELLKIGPGALVIMTSSTWAGPSQINAGTLVFSGATGADGGLSNITSAINVAAGASVKFDNTAVTFGPAN